MIASQIPPAHSGFRYERDAGGIVTVTMDMAGPVNAMNMSTQTALCETLDRLEREADLTGVVITSAKSTFFAGADLNDIRRFERGQEAAMMQHVTDIKNSLRRLEKLPVPVVAAINGSALGFGLELCLACNRRIAYDNRAVKLGLPEVTLGLMPGGGGTVRLVNLLGLEKALPLLLEGSQLTPQQAHASALIDATVLSLDDLVPSAKRWLSEHRGDIDAASQPWDRKSFHIPGGDHRNAAVVQLISIAPAAVIKKTRGLLPAPERILSCAVEALRLDFDVALRVETRNFVWLLSTLQAKNMLTTFFQTQQVNKGASRPKDVDRCKVTKVGVLGAGMMGQGIAYVCAAANISVVLKDVSLETAERGKAYSSKLLEKRVARGEISEERAQQMLALIRPTACDEDLAGCDLVIEAVFENMSLKRGVVCSTEPVLPKDAIFASNTSSLPITQLAESSLRPANFIGLHFFSPVDRMPLVEIICGRETSQATLAKACDFVQQLRKTPIVVNDSLGFFTSRTFGTYLDEGVRLLHEGVHPLRIEACGRAYGMAVGPLSMSDEVSLELNRSIHETWRDMGVLDSFGEQYVWREVLDTMVIRHGRGGRHHGGGFYEYAADGTKRIWPKLFDLYYKPDYQISEADIRDRLLFRSVIEAVKCLQEGVLRSVADGNVGSILGIGAPAWTGGYLQFINTYGLERFSQRCGELARCYGERFAAPTMVDRKIEQHERFV